MPFELQLCELARRTSAASLEAHQLHRETRDAARHLKKLRSVAADIERSLERLWVRARDNEVSGSCAAAGRRRACDDRHTVVNSIIDELSDALMDLQEDIGLAETQHHTLRVAAEIAESAAQLAAEHEMEFRRERDRCIARMAGVPAHLIPSGDFVVKYSPNKPERIDVYYNSDERRKEPIGPGHAHVVVGQDGRVRRHRPPRRVILQTVPAQTPLRSRRSATPMAA